MSFPKYPKYKDSGVEWLGKVPKHWNVTRADAFLTTGRSTIDAEALNGQTVFHYSIPVVQETGDGKLEDGSEIDSSKLVVSEEQVLVSKLNPRKGTVCVARPHAELTVCSSEFVPLIPLRANIQFIWHLVQTDNYRMRLESLVESATRSHQRVLPSHIAKFHWALPPRDEQTLIARFLDRETSKIDSLVAEQRRLIELLKEKRQAVISHAVTKGLNPHAPMKPSGIEWLGDVPEHWQLRRVKTVSSFVTSGPRGWSERIGETGSLFVQSGDLNDQMEVEFMTAKRVQVENDAESTRTRMREGDVVVCVTGAKTGNVAVCNIIPEPAYVNQHLCLIRPTPDVLPSFLGVLLKSRLGQIYFEISQYGLKQGLSLEDVEEAPVILPPVNEQQEIIALLDTETAKLDALTSEAERAIELLQERRTALISAAVTGKIDVRHLVEVN
jgi:type I restriction enzyme S subunit